MLAFSTQIFLSSLPTTWRHHPAHAGARRQWFAVVRSDIGLAPSAGSTPTAALYVSDCLGGLKAFNRQCRLVVTRPIAFAFTTAEYDHLRDAKRTDLSDGDGLCVHAWLCRFTALEY